MNEYEHYKKKVRREISKAKLMWMESLKKSKGGIWKAVRTITSSSVSDGMKSVIGEHSPMSIANKLNSIFSSVYTGPSLILSLIHI